MDAAERDELVGRLERALARAGRLLRLTVDLQTALTPRDVASVVTHHVQQELGTYFVGIALADHDRGVMSYLDMSPLPPQTMRDWSEFSLGLAAPVTTAVRTGAATFYATPAQAAVDFPGIDEHMAAAGTAAMAHLPLAGSRGRPLGTLAASFAEPRELSPRERDFLMTVAGHTAQALQRALLYQQQLSVAAALQGAVLPAQLPSIPGWDVVGRFEAAEVGVQVGGDWYDAFPLPGDRLGCVVGDAVGHGLGAARMMATARNSLRAYAIRPGGGPAAVLGAVDALLQQLEPDAMATVAYLELDLGTGAGVISLAGHPPPLLATPDGARLLELTPDPPLGVGRPEGRREHAVTLAPHQMLTLYTDGLVERRGASLDEGFDRLVALADPLRGEALSPSRRPLDGLVDQMLAGAQIVDDVCALAITRHGGRAVRAWFDPVASSVPKARAMVRHALREWHLPPLDDAMLVVSELVTNAVTHAVPPSCLPGRARVMVEVCVNPLVGRPRGVRVAVGDPSSDLPEQHRAEPGEEHGRGVMLVATLAQRWGVERVPGGKQVWAEFDLP